jgi:hypothetical protein
MRERRGSFSAAPSTKDKTTGKELLSMAREGKYIGPGCESCRGQLRRPRCKLCGFAW